jgi:hypothetical protein
MIAIEQGPEILRLVNGGSNLLDALEMIALLTATSISVFLFIRGWDIQDDKAT